MKIPMLSRAEHAVLEYFQVGHGEVAFDIDTGLLWWL